MRYLALAVAIAASLTACRQPSVTVLPESQLPEDVYGSPQPAPTAGTELPETETVYFVKNDRLAPANQPLQGVAASLPEALLLALLQGPAGAPRLGSEIPAETRLNSVEVEDGVANVDLSEDFDRGGGGRSLALRVAQVVYTLTEDPSVLAVQFSFEGRAAAVVAGRDQVPVIRPVDRDDYAALARPPKR